jgi:hypothetical protein
MRRLAGVTVGVVAGISREDWVLVISILITVLNLLLEYLERKRARAESPSPEADESPPPAPPES